MKNQLAVGVVGGAVFSVLLALAIGGSMTDRKIARALDRAEETSAAATQEATDALTARIAELEMALEEGTSALNAQVDERLATVEADVPSQLAAVSQEIEAQAGTLAALTDETTSAPEPQAEGAAADMPTSDAVGVGETAIFADGAVRVFVSALDPEAQTARLSVNGSAHSLPVGSTAGLALGGAECVVALVELNDAGAVIGSDCGVDTADAAPTEVPPAPEDGFTPGTTVSLADGALRVFVSALAADGSSARLAVNGIETVTVVSGTSIDVAAGDQMCTLSVTGVGNGMVGLEGDCS